MTETTNYNLKTYEGTDYFNPLTVENENMQAIDTALKSNADLTVTRATEIKTSTIHALTRFNKDADMFRFTATSNYVAGETFTVDGAQVTALTQSGTTLGDNAYIIGSEVLCCLKGTVLTFFSGAGVVATAENSNRLGGQEPSYYAKDADLKTTNDLAVSAGEQTLKNSQEITKLKQSYSNNFTTNEIDFGLDTNYTCPSSGMVKWGGYGTSLATLYVNDHIIGTTYGGNQAASAVSNQWRVNVGDVIRVTDRANSGMANVHFFASIA